MTQPRYRLNSPNIVAEIVDDEVITINMVTGVYFNMRGWSAHAWTLLAAGHSPAECEALLASAVGDVAVGTVDDFVAALLDDELLIIDPDAAAGEVAAPPAGAWSGLLLERFTDMTDLILLDPVHDVNPTDGWPRLDPA